MVVGAAFTAASLTEHRLLLVPKLTLISTLCRSALVIIPKSGNYPLVRGTLGERNEQICTQPQTL